MAMWVTRTVVFDSILFNQGGDARRWTERVTRRFEENARDFAPPPAGPRTKWKSRGSTGRLKASIGSDVDRIGPRMVQGTIAVNVPYALWVIRGTQGPIMRHKMRMYRMGRKPYKGPYRTISASASRTGEPVRLIRKGYMMKLPPFGGFDVFHAEVSGQPGYNFLAAAYVATSRSHRSLRGYKMPSFVVNP